MNYPHTCSVRDPVIISQRLSTESLYREKASQVWYELPSYMQCQRAHHHFSKIVNRKSVQRESHSGMVWTTLIHVVSESPPSFLKDCQQKVCIERKPLRYGMNYPHTCSVREPAINFQRLSTESLHREKASQVWYELPSYMQCQRARHHFSKIVNRKSAQRESHSGMI